MKLIACSDSNLDNFTHLVKDILAFSKDMFCDSLVKLTVVDGDGGLGLGLLPGLALAVHRDLVIDPKLALGHPGQVGLHQDLTRDVSGQHLEENVRTLCLFVTCLLTHLALGRHQEVDILNHVEEELVPPVLDALPPPSDLASDLGKIYVRKYPGKCNAVPGS